MRRGRRGWPAWIRLTAASAALAAAAGGLAAAAADATTTSGTTLVVGVAPIASIVEWRGDRPDGPMVEIWNELADRMGIETKFARIDTVARLITAVRDASIDVALGPLAITEERERSLDLSHPVFHSGMRIAVREKTDTGLLGAVKTMLSWQMLELLGFVLALVLVSGHLLWWFERGHNPRSFPPEYPRGVLEAIWWIASTIITGGCDDKHVDGPLGRILAFAWMAGGIGLIAAFTSVLTATMTAERVSGVIQGPRDLAGRIVGVQQAAVTNNCVQQRGGIPQEYATLRDAAEALSLGMVEAVVGETETLSAIVNEIGRGRLRVIGPLFDTFDFGIAMPNGSPFREPLNTALLRMREDGTLDRIKERWIGKHD